MRGRKGKHSGGRRRAVAKRVRKSAQTIRVRKNMDMDPVKLRTVKKILGARTETEAVDRALQEIIFEDRIAQGLERLAAAGGLPDVDPAS